MAKLIATSPTAHLLPLEIGPVRLEETQPEAITWVAPFAGQEKAVSRALGGWPGPGEMLEVKAGRAVSVAAGQTLILGAPVQVANAAVADQSDGWTVIAIDGAKAADVLARLTPIDLRPTAFKEGATARTLIGHMTASITRTGPYRYELLVFRSMTETLVHELTRAMTHIAGREKLG